jgi:hypothetical protein
MISALDVKCDFDDLLEDHFDEDVSGADKSVRQLRRNMEAIELSLHSLARMQDDARFNCPPTIANVLAAKLDEARRLCSCVSAFVTDINSISADAVVLLEAAASLRQGLKLVVGEHIRYIDSQKAAQRVGK